MHSVLDIFVINLQDISSSFYLRHVKVGKYSQWKSEVVISLSILFKKFVNSQKGRAINKISTHLKK